MHNLVTLRAEMPNVSAMCRDGTRWRLAWPEQESFRLAWMAGEAFWTGTDVWDQRVIIKLADIVGMVLVTQASLDLHADEQAEQKRREMMDGAAS